MWHGKGSVARGAARFGGVAAFYVQQCALCAQTVIERACLVNGIEQHCGLAYEVVLRHRTKETAVVAVAFMA